MRATMIVAFRLRSARAASSRKSDLEDASSAGGEMLSLLARVAERVGFEPTNTR
jgi:hypothetical protein